VSASPVWQLKDFLDQFDVWVEREHPGADRCALVMAWIHGLQVNPYPTTMPTVCGVT